MSVLTFGYLRRVVLGVGRRCAYRLQPSSKRPQVAYRRPRRRDEKAAAGAFQSVQNDAPGNDATRRDEHGHRRDDQRDGSVQQAVAEHHHPRRKTLVISVWSPLSNHPCSEV